MQSSTWQLLRDDLVVADLVVYGDDFPWLNARVFPKEGFEEIRPIFEEELRLVDDDENIQSWEDAYHRIRAEVCLAAPDGHLVPEFLLHIDGSEAWWRWTDEPFEDEGGSVTRDGP
jgi:hypothetical protein